MPAPALVASGGVAVAGGGDASVRVLHASDSATAIDAASVEDVRRVATAEDWGLLLVPFGTAGFAHAVLVERMDPDRAALWALAVFVATILAMREQDVSKLAARAADWLRPPRD
jgi:hypothetical protein